MEDSRALICAEKQIKMRLIQIALLITSLLIITGCYGPMTGTVIDAETGTPIEGAVIAADWTVTKGVPGLTYGKDYKLTEAVTDKEGKFKIAGTMNPFVNTPTIVIYKRGYVAWRNDYIFPNYEKRGAVPWESGQIFKLERFERTYSHEQHLFFLPSGFYSNRAPILTAACAWEVPFSQKERYLFNQKEKLGRLKESRAIWNEVIKELYLIDGDVK